MKWSHLPVAGGLYDQHPDLLDQWRYIFAKRAEFEAEERRQQEQKQKQQQSRAQLSSRTRGRR